MSFYSNKKNEYKVLLYVRIKELEKNKSYEIICRKRIDTRDGEQRI